MSSISLKTEIEYNFLIFFFRQKACFLKYLENTHTRFIYIKLYSKINFQRAEQRALEAKNMTPEEKVAEKLRQQKLQEESDLRAAIETFGKLTSFFKIDPISHLCILQELWKEVFLVWIPCCRVQKKTLKSLEKPW